jgi:hypothetical protein
MAKIKLGPMVGMASGSIGGTVFSHNRYGTYIRRRATPTKVTSEAAMEAKSRLASVSRAWGALTDPKREAWRIWAANNPIVDRLGDKQVLTGHTAYGQINSLLLYLAEPALDIPPVASAPPALISVSLVADIGAAAVELTLNPNPLAAGVRAILWGCVVNSESVTYVKNRLRLLAISASALASPWDIETILTDRFGTLQVGEFLHLEVGTFDSASGLRSLSLPVTAEIVSTGVATTLAVTLTPAGANDNGAMWSVDTGVTWYDSAEVVAMSPGAKTVTFHAADGYVTPDPAAKTVVIHTANTLAQEYTAE